MSCNKEIRNNLIEIGDTCCPFVTTQEDLCCHNQDIISDVHSMLVCRNCGQVDSYIFVNEFIDYHENLFKVRKKSIYHRKYHIQNTLNDICTKNRLQIPNDKITKIYLVFNEIDKILPQINGIRKRMISVKFILRRLLKTFKLPYNFK